MSDAPAEPVTPTPPAANRKSKRGRRQVVEWVVVIVAAALTAVVLRAEVVQAFEIPSLSMSPTLRVGDRVLVNKLGYQFHDVHRGDVIVFARPPGTEQAAIKDLIKRVIGLPGETVSSSNGKMLINGKELDEPYLVPGTQSNMTTQVVVPANHLWVMGDNRGQSRDSRFFGPIPKSSIIGRAFVRMWPLSHWGGL